RAAQLARDFGGGPGRADHDHGREDIEEKQIERECIRDAKERGVIGRDPARATVGLDYGLDDVVPLRKENKAQINEEQIYRQKQIPADELLPPPLEPLLAAREDV